MLSALEAQCDYALYKSTFTLHYSDCLYRRQSIVEIIIAPLPLHVDIYTELRSVKRSRIAKLLDREGL